MKHTTKKKPSKVKSKPAPARSVPEAVSRAPIEEQIRHVRDRFPIVGIGASAGGLEALEQFLKAMPPRPNAAFVVVQHLDPTQKGMLPELLQRVTTLTVAEATDGMRVEPEHIYVIPPNKDMSLLHGTLHLLPQPAGRGRVLPLRIRSKAGAYRWFKSRAVPIRDTAGTVVKWYGSSTDIDDVKRDEDRLSRAIQAISDGFVAVVGKPLTAALPAASLDKLRSGQGEHHVDGLLVHPQLDDDGGVWLFLRKA